MIFYRCSNVTKYTYAALKDLSKSSKFDISFGLDSQIVFELTLKKQ